MNKMVLCIALSIGITACTNDKGLYSNVDKIGVHWALRSNFTDEPNVFEAEFKLDNQSNLALTEKNWALFFNMSPRTVLENKTLQPANVVHLNGDWYSLVPNKGFYLESGESVIIHYRGVEGVIKDIDRPLGLYFVFYNDQGKEEKITEVSNFTWSPFTKPEQINRLAEDQVPIPTAQWSYQNNLNLYEVDNDQIKTIVPTPAKTHHRPGQLKLSNAMAIVYQNGLHTEATYLAARLKELTGTEFNLSPVPSHGKAITLSLDILSTGGGQSTEAYRLEISDRGITIHGHGAPGVFYGIQSLRSLIPLEAYAKPSPSFSLPYISIDDTPRFAFRGLHLDVSRNFQTKETILHTLDLLSFYKINRFLLYTTEDEGWRLEIKGLPELTEVGAQRQHTSGYAQPLLHPAYGSGPFAKGEGKYGHGYYSREDFIEILQYARDRHIKVIPVLNFPGHARAAIKAMEARYERLMKSGKEKEANEFRLIDPNDQSVYLSAQGYKDNVVCVARESVFHFYEKVLDEINAMYQDAGLTMDEFHAGGDEVPEGAWDKSPLVAELVKNNNNLQGTQNLQAYFFRELIKRMKSRNLQIDGWEEVALMQSKDGKPIPNPEFSQQHVVPFIWNNLFDYPDLGYRLANMGYPIVLCSVSNFYFDMAYNKDPLEPGLYWAGFVDTWDAWSFAPYQMFNTITQNHLGQPLGGTASPDNHRPLSLEPLKPEARKNILGVEAQVWSETVKGRDMLEYYLLPKLIGFSESAWSSERPWENMENKTQRESLLQKDWNIFANTLAQKELPRLSYLNRGYHYRIPPPGGIIQGGKLKANSEYPGLLIRYTTDGTEPTIHSTLYITPVDVKSPVLLKCFDASGKSSRTIKVIPS